MGGGVKKRGEREKKKGGNDKGSGVKGGIVKRELKVREKREKCRTSTVKSAREEGRKGRG